MTTALNTWDYIGPYFANNGEAALSSWDFIAPDFSNNGATALNVWDTTISGNPGKRHVWDGTQWVRIPEYAWNGSAWVQVL